jgi:pilus assembly protein CpaF
VQATALQSLETDVRELIRRRRLDPATDDPQVRQLVAEAVAEYDERALLGGMPPLADQDETGRVLLESVAGFGPLQPYLDDPSVEEIWINEPSRVFVARHGRSELTPTFLTEQQVHHLVERMLRSSGRRVDLSAPFVDASMPDGSRLHVCKQP